MFSEHIIQQVMAETLVFSFLQHEHNTDKVSSYLVPGIGLCKEHMILYMYDCKEDVLLGIPPLSIFPNKSDGIDRRTVVLLWLVLNYGLFCTGVPEELKKHKAGIKKIVGENILEMYYTKVSKPCHVKQINFFQPKTDAMITEASGTFYPGNYAGLRQEASHL